MALQPHAAQVAHFHCVLAFAGLMQKRFNELGAMLLSEQLQQLSDALSRPIRGAARPKSPSW